MADVQQLQLHITEDQHLNTPKHATGVNQPPPKRKRHLQWWILVAINILFLLAGQSVGTLLGNFYYEQGGNSKWMAALVITAGFPIFLPPLIFYHTSHTKPSIDAKFMTAPTVPTLAVAYISIGIVVGLNSVMYSYGLLYLPVSTFSLICATQLAFNALFSYFLNSQKITPLILNSILLLTFSASLLAVHSQSTDSKRLFPGKYIFGFLCTLCASAMYALVLALTQLFFEKVMKKESLYVVLEMQFYPSLFATGVCVVGLFASGDWKGLKGEMEGFGKGRVSYVMTLVWTAVSWQVFSIGCLALIYEVSSLFSNVISTLGLPVVPVLAVFFFHEKMDGVKIVAMLLALWGFMSYVYQHYLDDSKSKVTRDNVNEVSHASA
ncbi:putative purine permease 11 isoform X1 [Tasmannia lanceolata]|uniref:putative purine permease 11 isoform X1 n=1 Tax=Tasmannia lanceolata TaxID=3420 RepID=UPI004062BC20